MVPGGRGRDSPFLCEVSFRCLQVLRNVIKQPEALRSGHEGVMCSGWIEMHINHDPALHSARAYSYLEPEASGR
jgi:hypothetical protein